ncbi:TPA: ATP-binding protein [Vibrio vulnificus]|nr:ATP-binding protein [Vibrio vulnificus]HAS6387711.1 ATP-binding protein [Vibrio vulnificus]HAS6423494.1 ATP-binding protein [Vibrio vulnificus]HDY7600269.1 ATP-binding protein [Vibrio vulnificus]
MSDTTTVRLSCFGLISSIEQDLRDFILRITEQVESLPKDIQDKVTERYLRDNEQEKNCSPDLVDLLQYIDFSDTQKILHKLKKNQTLLSESLIVFICDHLDQLSPCRNRVCHSRPLESTDFFELRQFSSELIEKSPKNTFRQIKNVLNNLDNRAYLSTISTPNSWDEKKKQIFHNLPMVEFDDTGFLGRESDRDSINKLLHSDTRVITIVGEGGIGKTALSQRCLYDMLDLCEEYSDESPRFEIIAWVTLKANELTVNGARQINNAITDSMGLFQHVSNFLSTENESMDDMLDEILAYMREFKVLLCIDNLETISTSKIRHFLANIPNGSKVLITTRMALGELEFRYKLDKLDKRSSVNLIRNMSKILNVSDLVKKNNSQLENLCVKLFNNPLLIRWYVRSYAYGADPKKLINKNSDNFKDALSFCFENLYEKLTADEKKIILVIACIGKPLTLVEVRFFLDDMHNIALEEVIHRLRNSSMLMSSDDDKFDETKFILTNVAESYLKSINAITKDIYNLVKERRANLRTIIAEQGVSKYTYEFDPKNIVWDTNDQKICATYLSAALTLYANKKVEEAIEKVKQAKALMPDFSECYRIHGYILQKDQPWLAQTEYDTAIEYNEQSMIARYSYAKFLNSEEQYEEAIEHLQYALKIEPNSIPCKSQIAFTLKVMGNYEDANKIYDEILSDKKISKHKKFRISLYDQSSDCRRRASEQYINHKDRSEAKVNLSRAIDIIRRALDEDDYDKSIIDKLCKTYKESVSYYKFSDDNTLSINILSIIDDNIEKLDINCLRELKQQLNILLDIDKTENSYKLQQILIKSNSLLTKEVGSRINGKIVNLVPGHCGISYGFAEDSQNIRYFFSRSSLMPKTILDGRKVEENIEVCFTTGKTEKGFTAEDIEILN